MYVRMADGRDRGQVLDMVEDVARAMLANGQALPIDFSEPDPLGARELKAIEPEREKQEMVLQPYAKTSREVSPVPKAPNGHFRKKSSR